MTVAELIEMLEGCNPDAEVRLAEQPRWAFAYTLDDRVGEYTDKDNNDYVYLVEGRQLAYLNSKVAQIIGWSEDTDDEDDEDDENED